MTSRRRPIDPDDLLRRIGKGLWQYAHRLANNPGDLDADDLYQEGAIAALAAAERFDPTRGAKPETYCLRRGRGAMLDAARQYDECTRRDKHTSKCVVIATRIPLDAARTPYQRNLVEVAAPEPADRTTVEDFARHLRRVCGVGGVSERAARAAALYFAEDVPMSEVARREGYSESRASQIVGRVLAELQDAAATNGWTAADLAELLNV